MLDYIFIHPSILSIISQLVTYSWHLHPSLNPLIHQPIIHSHTSPFSILLLIYSHSLANHSSTHYIFIHLSIYSSIINQSMIPQYILFIPLSYQSSANPSFTHYTFIHSTVLSTMSQPGPVIYIFIQPAILPPSHPSISQELIYQLHLHPSSHPLIHQQTIDSLTTSSSLLPPLIHQPTALTYSCMPLSSRTSACQSVNHCNFILPSILSCIRSHLNPYFQSSTLSSIKQYWPLLISSFSLTLKSIRPTNQPLTISSYIFPYWSIS